MLFTTLIAAESRELRRRLRSILEEHGVLVTEARSADRLWARLGDGSYDLVLAHRSSLPGVVGAAIPSIRDLPDAPEVMVLTDTEDAEDRAAVLAAGAFAVVSEALAERSLREALPTLLQRRRTGALAQLQASRQEQRSGLQDFSARSRSMKELLRLAGRVVEADTTLLILGETGVGKEWLARAIHSESPRSSGPFVAVNCAAMPETLLESELFGHEKGAFTGATRAHRGIFELAHMGTIFLDEIGDLPFHLQVKLLRVLQEKTILRVGSEKAIEVDVRLMAATNQDLEEAMAEKRFRRDLFYRLSVMTLTVPPLRERREDIEPLVETYFDQFRTQLGRTDVEGLSLESMKVLEAYDWPGNVRELINVLERATLLCEGELITLEDLPLVIADRSDPREPPFEPASPSGTIDVRPWLEQSLPEGRAELVRAFEKAYLSACLDETRGNVRETAERAGIDPRTLYNKMRLYDLEKEQFKSS